MARPRSLLILGSCILLLQLGLLWVQGAQLHRQNRMISELHGDVEYLAEAVDQMVQEHYATEPESWSPALLSARRWSRASPDSNVGSTRGTQSDRRVPAKQVRRGVVPFVQVAQEEDPAARELKQSQESARKAVEKARQTQKALSLEEAAKRAEEAEKIKAAENAWLRWIWIGLGAGFLALLIRAWWRSRG